MYFSDSAALLLNALLSHFQDNASIMNKLKVAWYMVYREFVNIPRKYTKQPYFFHCLEVAHILTNIGAEPDIIVAGLLHDIVEDTETTEREISQVFNPAITSYVMDVTDVSKPEDGNRTVRKGIDREHLSKAHPNSKTLKLADLISNTLNITTLDPKFAEIYLAEKRLLLPHLIEGNATLFAIASGLCEHRDTLESNLTYLECYEKASKLLLLKEKKNA